MSSSDPIPLYDAHCHPTDTMDLTASIPNMRAKSLTIMSTRLDDQTLVTSLATSYPERVVPSFGFHPWFSYLLTTSPSASSGSHYESVLTPPPDAATLALLPPPVQLSAFLSDLRSNLSTFPNALVGEVGLDRGFRIPEPDGTSHGRREGRKLSPHRVSIEHQKAILEAQLRIAGELGRAVSVHGVQCHGALFDVFKELWKGWEESPKDLRRRRRRAKGGKEGEYEYLPDGMGSSDEEEDGFGDGEVKKTPARPYPPRICLHSFSGPVQTMEQYLQPQWPSTVYFSFSTTINARTERGHLGKIEETILRVPEDRLLIESDLHTAGEELDAALESAIRYIAKIREWDVKDAAARLEKNWKMFVYGIADRK